MSVDISEQTKRLFRKYGIPEDISGHFLKLGPWPHDWQASQREVAHIAATIAGPLMHRVLDKVRKATDETMDEMAQVVARYSVVTALHLVHEVSSQGKFDSHVHSRTAHVWEEFLERLRSGKCSSWGGNLVVALEESGLRVTPYFDGLLEQRLPVDVLLKRGLPQAGWKDGVKLKTSAMKARAQEERFTDFLCELHTRRYGEEIENFRRGEEEYERLERVVAARREAGEDAVNPMERESWRPEWTANPTAEWDHVQREGLTLRWLLDHYEECYRFIDARISARKHDGASAGGLARHGAGKTKQPSRAKKNSRQKSQLPQGVAGRSRGEGGRGR